MAERWSLRNCNMLIRRSARWFMPINKQPLSRHYKFGFWYDTENFADQEYDKTGLSLANPASTGIPRTHHGDFAYLCRDGPDGLAFRRSRTTHDRALNFFARAMGTPLGRPQLD